MRRIQGKGGNPCKFFFTFYALTWVTFLMKYSSSPIAWQCQYTCILISDWLSWVKMFCYKDYWNTTEIAKGRRGIHAISSLSSPTLQSTINIRLPSLNQYRPRALDTTSHLDLIAALLSYIVDIGFAGTQTRALCNGADIVVANCCASTLSGDRFQNGWITRDCCKIKTEPVNSWWESSLA